MRSVALTCADALRRPIAALGVDYPQFRLLLEMKLTLDRRRPPPLHYHGGDPAAVRERSMRALSVFVQLLTGGGVALVAGLLPPLAGMTLLHSMLSALLALALLAEFNSVIHDPVDDAVLRPLPIDERTVLAARFAHAGVFLGRDALILSAPALLLGAFWAKPLFVPALLLSVVENALFVVAVSYAVFLAVMRFASPRRFRDLVNGLQIALQVAFSVSYLVMPLLLDQFFDIDRLFKHTGTGTEPGWLLALPAAWFGALPAIALGADAERLAAAALAGLLVPLAGLLLVFRVLAPAYRRALQLAGAGARARRSRPKRLPLADRLAARALPGGAAAAFTLLSALVARDRGFRLRVLPAVAITALAAGANPLVRAHPGPEGLVAALRAGSDYLYLLYGALLAGTVAVSEISRSDAPASSWVFRALPFARPGEILLAVPLAVARRFALPILALSAGVTLAIWGPARLPDIALAVAMLPLLLGVFQLSAAPQLPFSVPMRQRGARSYAAALGGMVLTGAVVLLHMVLAQFLPALILAVAPFLLLLGLMLLARTARIGWTDLAD